jgi:cell division protein FtsW (lipid II flippase)
VGFILFAAIMMLMVGIWQALQGLVAIFENEFYVATRNDLFQFDATTWGWIHLVLGVIVAFAGWGLLSGRIWARVVAFTLAVLSAIANSGPSRRQRTGKVVSYDAEPLTAV